MAEGVQWCTQELTLSEMLADPIVRALMKADRVDPEELEVVLRSVAASRATLRPARTAR